MLRRRKSWRPWLLTGAALAGLVLAAGHGAMGTHGPLGDLVGPPRFDGLSQHIRYHRTFHDGHSHDGYGHGFHNGGPSHWHPQGGPPAPLPLIFRPSTGAQADLKDPLTPQTHGLFSALRPGFPELAATSPEGLPLESSSIEALAFGPELPTDSLEGGSGLP